MGEPGTETGRDLVAAAVARACEEVGFLVVKGHGINLELLQACAQHAKAFFGRPDSEKAQVAAQGRAYGFFPMSSEALGYDADVKKRPRLRRLWTFVIRRRLGHLTRISVKP